MQDSNKGENTNQRDKTNEENLTRIDKIFKRLTQTEFHQPLARNNTFQKSTAI
jgi:hypothetical protein